jgi:hypothetical protein
MQMTTQDSRFLLKTNTIIDTQAALEWIRDPLDLKELSGTHLLRSLDYRKAEKLLLELEHFGHKDWRIPGAEELSNFVHAAGPIIINRLSKVWFWTSSSRPLYNERFVLIFDGETFTPDSCSENSTGAVWPCRSIGNSEIIETKQPTKKGGVQ